MKKFIIFFMILSLSLSGCTRKQLSLPQNPIEFSAQQINNGVLLSWNNQEYELYSLLDAKRLSDLTYECIGFYNDLEYNEPVYICSVNNLSMNEWIIETPSLEHLHEGTLYKEKNVSNIPTSLKDIDRIVIE